MILWQANGLGKQSKARSHLAWRAAASSKTPDAIITGTGGWDCLKTFRESNPFMPGHLFHGAFDRILHEYVVYDHQEP